MWIRPVVLSCWLVLTGGALHAVAGKEKRMQESALLYQKVCDALAHGDTWMASTAASQWLLDADRALADLGIMRGSPFWDYYQTHLRLEIDQIAGTGLIEVQRAHFAKLSHDLVRVLSRVDLMPFRYDVDYCPMAMDGEGAYWLTCRTEEIYNPYFGQEMLHCGKTVFAHLNGTRLPSLPAFSLSIMPKGNFVHGCHAPGS